MRIFRIAFILVCALLRPAVALAFHDGHEPPAAKGAAGSQELQTWTLVEEGAHLHGSLLSVKDGKALIQREDGKVVAIAITRLSSEDQLRIANRMKTIQKINTLPAATPKPANAPAILQHFEPFGKSLKFRWDDQAFFVESDGMPDHPMMVGIRAWQQQVPMPQKYTGANAWRIPLHPVPAKTPLSAKTHFFRGAIALAVNGVPIFNPIKNDGRTDTFLAGELDEYGGHSGRADDYHYHLAPLHLQKVVGPNQPVAYALDGYPIYGPNPPNSAEHGPLDEMNGHNDTKGSYHYHSTKTYPYLNGGFHGEVVERDGQVDPQPRAQVIRPSLTPLRDAKITGFQRNDDNTRFVVEYNILGEKHDVTYTLKDKDSAVFTFNGPDGQTQETYRREPQGQGEGRRGPGQGQGQGEGRRGPGQGQGQGEGRRGPGPGQGQGQGDRVDAVLDKVKVAADPDKAKVKTAERDKTHL